MQACAVAKLDHLVHASVFGLLTIHSEEIACPRRLMYFFYFVLFNMLRPNDPVLGSGGSRTMAGEHWPSRVQRAVC